MSEGPGRYQGCCPYSAKDTGFHTTLNFVVCPASLDIYTELAADGSLAKITAAGGT